MAATKIIMKQSEYKELMSKSETELDKLLTQYRDEIRKAKVGIKLPKSKKVSGVGENKKSIARILTILKQKEMAKQ